MKYLFDMDTGMLLSAIISFIGLNIYEWGVNAVPPAHLYRDSMQTHGKHIPGGVQEKGRRGTEEHGYGGDGLIAGLDDLNDLF